MKKLTILVPIFISLFFHFGCNRQALALDYEDSKFVEEINGYSRDMFIHKDTLFVVNEDEGLLIYKINESSDNNSIFLDSLWSNSIDFQNNNLSGILYSDQSNRIFLLDKLKFLIKKG